MYYKLDDLIIAYKKVKNDIYNDKSNISILKIVQFEEDLINNLNTLLIELNNCNSDYFYNKKFLGGFKLCLKTVEFENNCESIYFSDHFNKNKKINDIKYRFIGDASIEFQVLGSLWIEKIGIQLEKNLSESAYGCRLDRPFQKNDVFVDETIEENTKHFQKLNSHFRPYFIDYKRWQEDSIKEIEKKLEEKKKIIVLTTDIKGFYHSIDADFLENYFLDSENKELSQHSTLNKLFINCLKEWSDQNLKELKELELVEKDKNHSGIPIGLSASKVIANLFLEKFDKEIENNLLPAFYGRYVDDMVIVFEDKNKIKLSTDLWKVFEKKLTNFEIKTITTPNENKSNLCDKSETTRIINFNNPNNSSITLNSRKEKIFILEGKSGNSFIESIKDSMRENSSEWRLLPDSEIDIENLNKEISTSSTNTEEAINGLRKADGVIVKRLKFALILRNFESFSNLAPENEWKNGVKDFIEFCCNFILTPENIATYIKYIPRIFGIAESSSNNDLFNKTYESYNKTWNILNEQAKDKKNELAKEFLDLKIWESILANSKINSEINKNKLDLFTNNSKSRSKRKEFLLEPLKLFLADLHNIAFKEIFYQDFELIKLKEFYSLKDIISEKNFQIDVLEDFLNKTKSSIISKNEKNESEFPNALFFFTRNFNSLEISLIYKEWSVSKENFENNLNNYLRLFNLPLLKLTIEENYIKSGLNNDSYIFISFQKNNSKIENPKIALTNFLIEDSSWVANVRIDNYEPDSKRFIRLNRIINDVIKECTRSKINIDYLVLPELSVPRKAILDIAKKLKSKGISLISGIEYEIDINSNYRNHLGTVSNQLIYILNINNGQYNDQLAIIQEKTIPAVHEETELFRVGGLRLEAKNNVKYIIDHNNIFFSGLICNDLLNIDNRQPLRGMIDILFVVEWNKDTDMYNHIVSATSNDLHCFIAQVNNRHYGDTRLRGPYKDNFNRDVARIQGGILDYFVVAEVKSKELREFQRDFRAGEKTFKPFPTGFKMSDERRKKDLK